MAAYANFINRTDTSMSYTVIGTENATISSTDEIELQLYYEEDEVYYDLDISQQDIKEERVAPPAPQWRKESKQKPCKARQNVSIHNPPGGWGLARM